MDVDEMLLRVGTKPGTDEHDALIELNNHIAELDEHINVIEDMIQWCSNHTAKVMFVRHGVYITVHGYTVYSSSFLGCVEALRETEHSGT